tara:strand:+ start:1867 stop:3297 length:1431 start_codon:yes stop_codon:yes gene_type:complete
MSNTDLPDALKFQNVSNPSSSKQYSLKTQPVSFSQSKARFEIPRQGILSSNAMLQFSGRTGMDNATYTMLVGCLAQVERATLSTASGKVIMDNRHFSEKQVVEVPFRGNTYNTFKAPYLNMSYYGFAPPLANEDATDTVGTIRPSSIQYLNATGSSISPQKSVIFPTTGNQLLTPNNIPSVQIQLAQMFPFLYNTQLPVGSMEQLFLDIYWRPDSAVGRLFVTNNATAYASQSFSVNQVDTFLHTDHITYDDPSVMEEIENRMASNLQFVYTDCINQLVNTPVASPVTASIATLQADLGCVNYKLTGVKNIALEAFAHHPAFGYYYSYGEYTNRNINLVINDSQLYPNNNQTQAENYTRLTKIYDMPAQIPKPLYSGGRAGTDGFPTTQLFNGFAQLDFWGGDLNIQAIELKDEQGKALQNGLAPIRLIYERNVSASYQAVVPQPLNKAELQYYFIEYLRSFAVSGNGNVMVSEFI